MASRRVWNLALGILVVVLAGTLLWGVRYVGQVEERMAQLDERLGESEDRAAQAIRRALQAEEAAQAAAREADAAEQRAADARQARIAAEDARIVAETDADMARQEAEYAAEIAAEAEAEAERLRAERDAEMQRLEDALGRIAETQRTALGLVMNLGEESINFDTDKAELKPEDRELLARIAGVLLTADGFRLQVFGHTDDVGTQEYNQGLSERRARAVRDYLVDARLSPEIITMKGFGKTKPLVSGTSAAARARNRRVEIGIIDTVVQYTGTDEER